MKQTGQRKMKLVEVVWVDSFGVRSVWEDRAELEPIAPVEVVSVGFVVEETASHITLTQSVSGGQIMSRLCIPKGCVTGRRVL
ncbi:MAG: hypothetical protein WC959_10645 [Kiritimatiellales bacterium]